MSAPRRSGRALSLQRYGPELPATPVTVAAPYAADEEGRQLGALKANPLDAAAEAKEKSWRNYRAFVLLTAAAHAGAAAGVLVAGLSKDWPVTLCASYSSWTPAVPGTSCADKGTVCRVGLVYKRVGSLSPVGMLAAFSLLSALFQGVPAFPGLDKMPFGWARYRQNVEVFRRQPMRWIEYSVSSTLMVMTVLLLNGTVDFWIYVGVGGCNWCCMMFGLLHEELLSSQLLLEEKDKPRSLFAKLAGHFLGWVPFALVWLVLVSQFAWSIHDAQVLVSSEHKKFPSWIVSIIVTQMVLFVLFGVNQALGTYALVRGTRPDGKPRVQWWTYERSEVWYTVLSLSAKQLLVWLLYFGTTMRNPKYLVPTALC